MRGLTATVLALAAGAGQAAVVIEPAIPAIGAIDPQATLLAFDGLPLGASARVRVAGGDRVLTISGTSNVRVDVTQGGGPNQTVTTEGVVNHLLGASVLTGDPLEAADLNLDGLVDAGDLVRIVLYGGSLFTGGDPFALISATPDGEGPLNDGSGLSGFNFQVREDGNFAGNVTAIQVPELVSLVPHPMTVLPGGTFNLALQIDSESNFAPTVAYRARLLFDSGVLTPGSVRGAVSNEDFEDPPSVVSGPGFVELSDSVAFRADLGAAVINVANVTFTVNSSTLPLTHTAIVFDQGNTTLTPSGQPPLPPGIGGIRTLGCGIRVGP